jgi:hypothetical protein
MLAVVSYFTKPFVCRLVGIVILLAGWAAVSQACDTPVYRYAMYRWEPAPYEIYYFHDQPLDEQAEQVKQLVEAASRSEEKPANAFFIPVSLTDDPELKRIPPDVRKAWQDQEERQVPTYWVVTPHGRKLYQGTLDEATLGPMWDSPARADMAQQLAAGSAGVLVMLEGSDAAANEGAEKVVKELIAEMAAGKVEVYLPPTMGADEEDAAAFRLQLGLVKIARTDPAEKWLVDSLLSLEDDLRNDEFAAQPMIFAVFGRGRALPPFIGKGITRDNLLECVYFLTGACSCTVKDQNPGMDLLFAEDWWSVAENLASTFGAEEGNETQLGADQLFPHLMIPGGEQVADASAEPADSVEGESQAAQASAPAAETVESQEPDAEPVVADASTADTSTNTEQAAGAVEPAAGAEPAAVEPAAATTAGEAAADHAHSDSVHGTDPPQAADAIGLFAVGAGLCVALVVLFGVTFLVMRPK